MMLRNRGVEWGTTIHSVADGTLPTSAFGVSITPVQNAYGSYVTLIAGGSLTCDCLELTLCVNTAGISGVARDCVVSLATDPAGGTSFTPIPGADLVCGPAGGYTTTGGAVFCLRLWIKAGTSIGIAAAVNSSNLTALNAFCRVRGRPNKPQAIYVGSYIDSFGVTLASSAGTAVTPGTSSDGTYVQLGSALTRPCSYWEYGVGINNSAMNNNALHVDVAVGTSSNKKIQIPNAVILSNTSEQLGKSLGLGEGQAAVGDLVYARCQIAGTTTTGISIAAYGIGG